MPNSPPRRSHRAWASPQRGWQRLPRFAVLAVLAAFIAFEPFPLAADEPQPVVDYDRQIAPLLHTHCVKCHGGQQPEAGLRLDSPRGWRAGGDSGPTLVPGNADQSRIIVAVTGSDPDNVSKMPPEDQPQLTAAQIDLLRHWISQGANAKEDAAALARVTSDHWAFQSIRRPLPPPVEFRDWVRNPVDAFVLKRLEDQAIAPSAEAPRDVLLRRLSLDLRGFPPTADEIRDFQNDPAADAYEQRVERYLASPAFGERWGRYWLDAARYADSNGYTRDFGREIWKYRDWVIAAVNRDLPFDQFTVEQFAGDLLPDPTLSQRIATGFHRNTLINEEGGTDKEQFRVDAVADRVATTGSVFLGLTLGCARCHQHKYDPISQREYYQLFAFLNNCEEPTIDAPDRWQIEMKLVEQRDDIRRRIQDLEKQLEEQQEAFQAARLAWEETITPEKRATLPGPVQAALDLEPEKRDDAQQKLVADLFKESESARQQFPLVGRIAQLQADAPAIPTTMVLEERSEPRSTFVHRRGNFLDPGVEVQPEVPAVLPPLEPRDPERPANRLDFARWLVAEQNPLTARVTVNRFWQRLFGHGIVETEDDFGVQGAEPTHPELLDWLASEFRRQGWSRKALIRTLVTSSTYRQSSNYRTDLADLDPRNKLLARQSRLRLDAEIIRDSALAVSGLLCRTIGGPSVHPPQPEGVFEFTQDPKPWPTETGADRYRRGMYIQFWRSSPYPGLMVFDFPDSNVTCTRRVRSNTPLQALTLANDLVFLECARALGEHVMTCAAQDDERIRALFLHSVGRDPTTAESERVTQMLEERREYYRNHQDDAKAFLAAADHCQSSPEEPVELASWVFASRVLLNLDEFITRE